MSTEVVTNPVAQAADYIEKNLCRCVVNRSVCPVHYGNQRIVGGIKVYDPVPVSFKPFCCKIGWHDYIDAGEREVTEPMRGPFDPRSKEQRTTREQYQVCALCGTTRRKFDDYIGYGDI